jgi:hypothetical protein
MTFEEVLDQALEMLRRRGRMTYRALQRQFGLDDAYLADLKAEIIERSAWQSMRTALYWSGPAVQLQPHYPSLINPNRCEPPQRSRQRRPPLHQLQRPPQTPSDGN